MSVSNSYRRGLLTKAGGSPLRSIDSLGRLAVKPVVEQCRDILQKYYKERLKYLVLYGSAARKQIKAESDIDLLVVLEQPLDHFQEMKKIVELLYPLQLEASHWISAKPVAIDEFELGKIQLYRNALEEGVVV